MNEPTADLDHAAEAVTATARSMRDEPFDVPGVYSALAAFADLTGRLPHVMRRTTRGITGNPTVGSTSGDPAGDVDDVTRKLCAAASAIESAARHIDAARNAASRLTQGTS